MPQEKKGYVIYQYSAECVPSFQKGYQATHEKRRKRKEREREREEGNGVAHTMR